MVTFSDSANATTTVLIIVSCDESYGTQTYLCNVTEDEKDLLDLINNRFEEDCVDDPPSRRAHTSVFHWLGIPTHYENMDEFLTMKNDDPCGCIGEELSTSNYGKWDQDQTESTDCADATLYYVLHCKL